jgi:hypothetical protein
MAGLEDDALDNILDGDEAGLAQTTRRIANRNGKRAAPVVGRVGM